MTKRVSVLSSTQHQAGAQSTTQSTSRPRCKQTREGEYIHMASHIPLFTLFHHIEPFFLLLLFCNHFYQSQYTPVDRPHQHFNTFFYVTRLLRASRQVAQLRDTCQVPLHLIFCIKSQYGSCCLTLSDTESRSTIDTNKTLLSRTLQGSLKCTISSFSPLHHIMYCR